MATPAAVHSHFSRKKVTSAAVHSLALAISSLISYWLVTHLLRHVDFVSQSDELLGGMWAVVATVFVFRYSYDESHKAAVSRITATLVSFILCLAYLAVFPFHLWGLAVLIGLGALIMMLVGRPDDVVTTTITTAVVMVVAALSPQSGWEQPILRLLDTVVGVPVGLAGAWVGLQLTLRLHGGPGEVHGDEATPHLHRGVVSSEGGKSTSKGA
jgi:uncharacterized membrane protein YgaE (UPF0421/DUF939 family)